jgi:predicted acetyltransferase
MSRAETSPVSSQEIRIAAPSAARSKQFDDSRRKLANARRSNSTKSESPESRSPPSESRQSESPQIEARPGGARPRRLAVNPLADSGGRRIGFRAAPPHKSGSQFRPARNKQSSTVALRAATVTPIADEIAGKFRFGPITVERGRAGDHSDVYQLLLAVCHAPSRDEFQAAQEEPAYEPSNRLLIKRGGRIISHAQLIPRTMLFGNERLPIEQLTWLATLPEFRSRGCAGELLGAATRAMAAGGTLVGLVRTRIPHFFHRWGWAVCGRHSQSRAKARQILARYWADAELRRLPLNIRLWRHVELPALMRIYAQNTATAYGPLERTEAYWRWLIGRKAFDHIFVALAGPDKLELNEATAPIVGYAVVRQNRVVELLTDPAHPTAGAQLLARACADAIERDQQDIILEAPPQSPLHPFIAAAEGEFHHREANDQEVFMMRLIDTAALARRMAPQWAERMQASGISRQCELGLHVGEQKYRLSLGRRGVQFGAGRLGRNYISCNRAELTRLMMGHSDPVEAAALNRLTPSTQVALQLASTLFPRLPLWRPSWDDLSA